MYEKRHQPLAHRTKLYKRLLNSTVITFFILMVWLLIGIFGYRATCNFGWGDSLLNASMILSGMGPTNPIDNNVGKVFASIYAILSGVIFITSVGVLLAPLVHRFMHQFNLPED